MIPLMNGLLWTRRYNYFAHHHHHTHNRWSCNLVIAIVTCSSNPYKFCTWEAVLLTCQVNSYPTVRGFTAIGTGGDDFVQAMVIAVESVTQQTIPEVYVLSYCRCKSLIEKMFKVVVHLLSYLVDVECLLFLESPAGFLVQPFLKSCCLRFSRLFI